MDRLALVSAREEAAKLADMAACAAGLLKGAARSRMVVAQRRYNAAALHLADALDGPVCPDIAALDDVALLAELGA